jgi:hypothetical protein
MKRDILLALCVVALVAATAACSGPALAYLLGARTEVEIQE